MSGIIVRPGRVLSCSISHQVPVFLLALLIGIAPPALAAQSTDPPGQGPGAPEQPPGQGETKPKSPKDTPAATRARTQADPPITTFSVQAFQIDPFTGAATAEVPVLVPPGTAGVAPKIALRYNSGVVDELGATEQGQGTGLGWTLDTGGFVLRDTKLTTSPNDDTFKVVFGGVSYDLVLVNAGQNIYHTKDETFWELQYSSQSDYWTLKTKDGTLHRFGFNTDSKAIGVGQDLVTQVTYRYLLDEVKTTSGTSVRYSYFKQTARVDNSPSGQLYDQAVYPDVITYAYNGGSLVGSAREVRFFRASRSDYTDTTSATHVSFFERDRLDSIEVKVGGSLVRKYVFGFDYSIDRDPTYTWGGGVTGDLTLRSVTMYGTDGVSALPALTFNYTSGGRLASANNGIGGTVSYSYERVTTPPTYTGCVRENTEGTCVDYGMTLAEPNPLLWYLLPTNHAGAPTQALYGGCVIENESGCVDWWGTPNTFLGNVFTSSQLGTYPINISCIREFGDGGCADHGLIVNSSGADPIIGYVYRAKIDRYRVTSRTLSDGLGWTSSTTFSYQDLRISDDAKEFRGHAKVRSTDPLGHYTDTWFFQDDAKRGRPYQIENRSNTGALFSQVNNTWSATNPYPGVTFVFLTRTDNYECDGQATCLQTAQTFAYDSNGNPIQTYHLGKVALTGDERDERTDWSVDTATWIHRPSRVYLQDNVGTIFRERWLSYDSLGRLTREESRLAGAQGNAGNPVVTHVYDAYGNRTSTTDPRGCTTNIAFDSSQTYPATVTTCLSHTTSFQYDARFGVVTSQTDPNNQTTTSTYDVFGRLTRITGPLDTTSTYGSVSHFYLDWGTPSLQRIETYRTEQHGTANVTWSQEYFDGLGRVDKIRSEGPGGQTIITDTNYDARGQVSAQSAPYFSTETPVYTQFTYDVLGRQTRVDHPDGTFATASYVQDVITLTDERGNIKRKYLDAYDRLERVDEVNGAETYVTTYQYDVAGSLTRVTNHLGHVTTMTYDLLGRKSSMSDPNMGAWSYAYDLGGNLTSQTDAKNQTITFTYDLQSRLVTKRYPNNQQITWTYDDPAVAYSKGRLTRVVDLATTTNFTYDQIGRVTQTQRVLTGVTYTMSQSYDALGRVTSETFPDNDSVTYSYNEAGWLSAVTGYINSITYNARGQKTQLQHANGVTTNWTYNAQNFRVTNRATSGGAGSFQNLSYGYDNLGNITAVTDTVYTGSRSFTYDALNRLTSATGNFGPSQSLVTHNYSYDAIGNILNKAGVTYSYTDAGHPSAVTSLSDGKSYSYDANGNMVTGGNRNFVWDYDNRVTSVTTSGSTTSMFYDYTGTRVEKSGPLGTTIFPFSGYEIGPGGITVKYIRIGIENVASKKSTGETLFYHNDHLGGVNVITNASGLLAQLVEYDPWGKISRSEGAGDSLRRFTGQQLDPESGLYYYGGRYYDPELGRFISPDPFVPQADDPQSLNRYSYVVNNPVNLIDPSGYSWFSKLFKKIGKVFKAIFSNPVVKIITGIALIATGFGALAGEGLLAGAIGFGNIAWGINTSISGLRDLAGQGGGGIGPPGGEDFGSPGSFTFAFAGGAPGDDYPSPALNFWRLASSAVQIAQQLGGDRSSGSRGRRTSGSRSTGEGFRTGEEERVPCTMNPNDRGCIPGPGPENPNPLQVTKDPSLDVDPCRNCKPPNQNPAPGQFCTSDGFVCKDGQPVGRPPAKPPGNPIEALRRGMERFWGWMWPGDR